MGDFLTGNLPPTSEDSEEHPRSKWLEPGAKDPLASPACAVSSWYLDAESRRRVRSVGSWANGVQ